MRISDTDQRAFVTVLSPYINEKAELRLFGSRVNDQAKGGDIDLLLLVSSSELSDKLMYFKAKILSEIKAQVGDQKIDLYIAADAEKEQDVFVQSILPESVVLYSW